MGEAPQRRRSREENGERRGPGEGLSLRLQGSHKRRKVPGLAVLWELRGNVGTTGVSWEALGHLGVVWGLVRSLGLPLGLSLGLVGLQNQRKRAVDGGARLGAPWQLSESLGRLWGISEWSLEGSWPVGGCGKPVVWTLFGPYWRPRGAL